MINIIFYKNKDSDYFKFKACGHTDYEEYGKEIICASVSSVSQMVLAGLLEVIKADVDYRIDDDGLLEYEIFTKIKEAQTIIEAKYIFLMQLGKQYREYLHVGVIE